MCCNTNRPLWIISVILYIIALITYIISVARVEWFKDASNIQYGLFRVCQGDKCVAIADFKVPGFTSDVWRTSQILTSLALALLIVTGAVLVFSLVTGRVMLQPSIFCLLLASGSLGISGGAHYLDKGEDYCLGQRLPKRRFTMQWAASLCFLSGSLQFVCAIVLLAAFLRWRRSYQQL